MTSDGTHDGGANAAAGAGGTTIVAAGEFAGGQTVQVCTAGADGGQLPREQFGYQKPLCAIAAKGVNARIDKLRIARTIGVTS